MWTSSRGNVFKKKGHKGVPDSSIKFWWYKWLEEVQFWLQEEGTTGSTVLASPDNIPALIRSSSCFSHSECLHLSCSPLHLQHQQLLLWLGWLKQQTDGSFHNNATITQRSMNAQWAASWSKYGCRRAKTQAVRRKYLKYVCRQPSLFARTWAKLTLSWNNALHNETNRLSLFLMPTDL